MPLPTICCTYCTISGMYSLQCDQGQGAGQGAVVGQGVAGGGENVRTSSKQNVCASFTGQAAENARPVPHPT